MGWEGACKKAASVGDLQGVFHHMFIDLHLSDGLGMCMQKDCLCWRTARFLPIYIYLFPFI